MHVHDTFLTKFVMSSTVFYFHLKKVDIHIHKIFTVLYVLNFHIIIMLFDVFTSCVCLRFVWHPPSNRCSLSVCHFLPKYLDAI